MNKIELKNFLNNQLSEVDILLGNHLLSVNLIPNKKYLNEKNQREMKWIDDDNDVFEILEQLQNKLLNLKKNL